MGRVPDLRRLNKEDFDKQYQELIDKLAFPWNSFMEQTRDVLDHGVDFTNLNQELIVLTTITDDTGTPVQKLQYKSNLKTKVAGHSCITAINQTNPSGYPTSTPFISYSQNGNIVTINNITSLVANQKYQVTVLSIGS